MNDTDPSTIIAKTVANLVEVTARNTVGNITTTIKSLKTSRDKDKTINKLTEIINELLADKLELEQIATTFKNELVSQQISDEDIKFIVNTVVPIIKDFAKDDPKQQEYISYIEKLLSKESVKVMQLIGFNYREAIGGPLTRLCSSAILNLEQTEKKRDIQGLSLKNQTAIATLSQDRDSYNRFVKIMGLDKLVDKTDTESRK